MACGVPVVGTRSGAIPEVVEDGETGILVPPNDPVSMANAIQKLAQDRHLLSAMRTQAIRRVKDRFTVQRAVSETVSFYQDLQS
jgi:glycosyltransferase involved in cell wall biosynthesis